MIELLALASNPAFWTTLGVILSIVAGLFHKNSKISRVLNKTIEGIELVNSKETKQKIQEIMESDKKIDNINFSFLVSKITTELKDKDAKE